MGLSFLGPFLAPSVFPEEDPGVAEKYFSEKIIPSELKTASKDLQQDLGGWSPFFRCFIAFRYIVIKQYIVMCCALYMCLTHIYMP